MAEEPLFVQNRIVVIVTPRAPLVDWMNRVFSDVADPVTLEQAQEDPNAFLVPVRPDEYDTPGAYTTSSIKFQVEPELNMKSKLPTTGAKELDGSLTMEMVYL